MFKETFLTKIVARVACACSGALNPLSMKKMFAHLKVQRLVPVKSRNGVAKAIGFIG